MRRAARSRGRIVLGLLLAAFVAQLSTAQASRANNITNFTTVFDTDVTYAGFGGMRGVGTGTLTVAGVTGTVQQAFLYWQGPTNSSDAQANATVMFAGSPVTGANIGFSSDNCWGATNSQAYRADVTALVTGDGTYALADFVKPNADVNGASLIVFFDDGNSSNNRDVVIFDGNDSNIPNSFDADGWNVTLSGIQYTSGSAQMDLVVADGQTFSEDGILINGQTLVPPGPNFSGDTTPRGPGGPGPPGNSLWDVRSFDITSFLTPGNNTLTLTSGQGSDCLSLVVAAVNLPAGAAPRELTLEPNQAENPVGTTHTVTATLVQDGNPVSGATILFDVSGANTASGSGTTNASGQATFTYTGTIQGADTIGACHDENTNGICDLGEATATASKTFLPVPGYARPKSATPLSVQLVPAFNDCTSANSTHGAPLASPSCNPPNQSSTYLTFNAPDRSAPYNTAANGGAIVTLKLFCTNGASPPCSAETGDQQDVRIDTAVAGVRCVAVTGGCPAAGGSYSGKVLGVMSLRATDRLNGSGETGPGTVVDAPLAWGVQCADGACSSSTSADAVLPGLVREGKRAIWGLSGLEMLDGGSDGKLLATLSGTCPPACQGNGDETRFLMQGLFIP